MNSLVAILMLAAVPALASTQQHVMDAQALTVLVTNEGFLGGGRGSGVIVDGTHVVTCAHMIGSMKDELFIYTYPLGTVVKGHAEYVDVANDLMLVVLETTVTARNFATFDENYYDGEPITIIGNALGSMKWIVSHGVVSGTERDYILTDANVNQGNSGGPWVNENGAVVALTDWGISTEHGPGIAGGISAKKITSMFARYEASKKMAAVLDRLFGGGN